MCGRYTVFTEDEVIEMREIMREINERYINTAELARMKTGEVFPTDTVPVLVAGEARLMTWGFPKWQGSGVIINARAETAMEKQMFRGPLMQRRCVVPSTGFYEWRHEGGKSKEKYLISLPGERMLYMAGFYSTFKDKDGKPYAGFVILTAEANGSIAPLHNRMPVVLSPEERMRWLCGRDALGLLERRDGREFSVHKVSA